jgi:hypothetical protein
VSNAILAGAAVYALCDKRVCRCSSRFVCRRLITSHAQGPRGYRYETVPAVIPAEAEIRLGHDVVCDLRVASMQQLLPVGRDASGGSWRRLIEWVMMGRRELWAVVVELFIAVVVEPLFFGLITGDPGMSGCFGVGGGMLTGRVVAAPDVAALRAPAQVKPPAALLFALHAALAGGRDSGVDALIFPHLFHPDLHEPAMHFPFDALLVVEEKSLRHAEMTWPSRLSTLPSPSRSKA